MARRTAYQLIDAAEVIENVRNCAQTIPQTESQARPLTRLEPEVQQEVWQEVIDATPTAQITARVVEEKANSTARQFPQLGKSTKPGASAGCGKPTKTYKALHTRTGASLALCRKFPTQYGAPHAHGREAGSPQSSPQCGVRTIRRSTRARAQLSPHSRGKLCSAAKADQKRRKSTHFAPVRKPPASRLLPDK